MVGSAPSNVTYVDENYNLTMCPNPDAEWGDDEIEAQIGRGGITLSLDNCAVWIKKGSPFAQRMGDSDDMVRRIYMNIEAEFLTA